MQFDPEDSSLLKAHFLNVWWEYSAAQDDNSKHKGLKSEQLNY